MSIKTVPAQIKEHTKNCSCGFKSVLDIVSQPTYVPFATLKITYKRTTKTLNLIPGGLNG